MIEKNRKHDRGFDFVNIDTDRWRGELYEARVILWENTARCMTMTIGRSSKKRRTVYRVTRHHLILSIKCQAKTSAWNLSDKRDSAGNAIIRNICWIIGRTDHIMGNSPLGSTDSLSPSPWSRYLAVPLERLCSRNMDRGEGQKWGRDVWYKPPKIGTREPLWKLLWQLSWFVRVDSMHPRRCHEQKRV